jgi:glycosyltransferase involved in cell wall biosynthesis
VSALHDVWRLLPRDWRREALFSTMAALAPRPTPGAVACLPITVAGYHSAPTGLGQAARLMAALVRAAGFAVHVADLTGVQRQGDAVALDPGPAGPGTLILVVNGPMLPWAMRALGRSVVAGKRVIAQWAWELPELAPDWRRGLGFAHEIWTPSQFIAEAVRRAPGAPPVHILPHPIEQPDPATGADAEFGLPPDAFLTLVMFDAGSSIARKNPQAAIAAHQAAFGDRPDRVLVLKVHGTAHAGPGWRALAAEVAGRPNIVVIDRFLTRRQVWALQARCDVLLSLHRAEGFGLALAEAMRLGKPVIATGWSGNVDFMPPGSALLVPATLVPARDPQKTYEMPATQWADPDIAAAADMLRRLADDPAERARIGQAAGQAAEALALPKLAVQLRGMLEMPG